MADPTQVGQIYLGIRADIRRLSKDLADAQREAKGGQERIQRTLNKINLDKATDSFQRFQRVLSVGLAGYGIKRIADDFIEVASSFQMMQTKLEALEGSRGTRLFETLNKMALELPVSTQKVVQSFVTMQAMGLDPTRKQMLILSDVAAVLGDDVFDRVVLQLGQMSAKGKIMAQDLNIMAEAGINVRGILQEAFGKTVEELQAANVDINEIIGAIFEGMNKKFSGSSEKIMHTWRGVTELLKSNWIEIERTVANAGLFDFITKGVEDVAGALKTWLDVNRELIKQEVPQYVDKIRRGLETVRTQFENLWKILNYDTDIIEYGMIGLLIGGKKGAVAVGGVAHLLKIPGMLAEASALAAQGYVSMADVAMADYKELEKIIEQGRKLQAGIKPKPVELLASHGGNLQRAHGGIKSDLVDIEKYSDGWRKRWDDEWNVWGYRTDRKFLPSPKLDTETLKKTEGEIKKFREEYNKSIMSETDFERYQLDIKLKEYSQYITDKKLLDNLYFRESMKIRQKEMLEEASRMSEPASEKMGRERLQKQQEFNQAVVDENDRTFVIMADRENVALMDKVKRWDDTHKQLTELTERTADAMQDNFSNLFFDAMTGKLKTLEDYARAVFDSIARMISDLGAQELTRGLFGPQMQGGGWLSSLGGLLGFGSSMSVGQVGGTMTASQTAASLLPVNTMALPFHSGGYVGSNSGPMRSIPASYYSAAPRLHNGLMPDEFPAILQRGERVIKKGGSQSNNITVNVSAPNGRMDRESLSTLQSGLFAALSRSNRRNG